MSLEDLAKKAEEGFEKVVDAAKEKAEEAKDEPLGSPPFSMHSRPRRFYIPP